MDAWNSDRTTPKSSQVVAFRGVAIEQPPNRRRTRVPALADRHPSFLLRHTAQRLLIEGSQKEGTRKNYPKEATLLSHAPYDSAAPGPTCR